MSALRQSHRYHDVRDMSGYANGLNRPWPLVGGTDTAAGSTVVLFAAVNGHHNQHLFLATRQKL